MSGSSAAEPSSAARSTSDQLASAGAHGDVDMSGVLRARVLSVAVALVGEVGYARMTVKRVVRLSGVSQETFHESFQDLDDCLLAAFEDALERIAAVVVPAYAGEREWPAKMRAAVAALLTFVQDEPAVSTFVFVGALGAGPKVLACRMGALERLKVAFENGIDELGGAGGREIAESSPLSAEGAVNALLGILHTRLLEGSPLARRPLSVHAGPLTAMIVLPYVGHVAAGRELAREPSRSPEAFPAGAGDAAPSPADPAASNGAGSSTSNGVGASNGRVRSRRAKRMLQGRETAISERGLRVLAVIDERNAQGSSPSNREIAEATEIRDQGQMSKLMHRLAGLGFVENTGAAALTGKAYAWRLTIKGTELLRELGAGALAASTASNGAGSPTSNSAGASTNGHDRSGHAKGMLQGLEIQISKRQLKVLAAISELNARGSVSSNHAIRDATEIEDQAEMSQLLKELARLGLVESSATGRGTYAWRLTSKGSELLGELEEHTVAA